MAEDTIVVAYKADLTQLEAGLAKIEAKLTETESTAKKSADGVATAMKKPLSIIEQERRQLDILQKSRDKSNDPKAIQNYNVLIAQQQNKLKGLTTATDAQVRSVKSLSDQFKDLLNNLPFANQIQQVTQLGSAVTGLGPAAQKSSGGFQVLKLAIASTGIGALIIGIIALIAYFKRTDEGAAKLSGIMSALGAATDLVTGFVVGLGDSLFKALTSVDGFKDGLSDLGDFIVQNLINRFNGLIGLLQATSLALRGQFAAAGKKALDSIIAINTGVTDATSKIAAFSEKAAAAAAAAFEWELKMDALEDKIRENSKTLATNDAQITKLIIASKNKNIEDEKSLAFLDEATRLEKQNLAIVLANENARLKLIQERNKREQDSISQDGKRRDINDKFAQEEVDQINKITQLQQASDNLLEKVNNRRDAKLEEIFQNQVKRLAQEETIKENIAKQEFVDGTKNAQQLEDALYNIKLQGLQAQKELFVSESRDIVDIDKAILDLELSNLDKHNKEREALEKAAREAKEKADKKANDDFLAAVEARIKEEEEKLKAHQAKIAMIREAGFNVADELAQGFADNSAKKRSIELNEELSKSQQETEGKTAFLQKQLDDEIITQEQFDARKAALDQKQAQKEAEIKKRQFQSDKKAALIKIAIDTALAVAKTIANLGYPAGLLAAALALAQGAAQAAVVAAQPTPKFKKGGWIKGKDHDHGGVHIEAEGGEFITNKVQSGRYSKLLESVNSGKADKYIYSTYVVPEMEKLQRSAISRKEAKERDAARRMEMLAGNTIDMSQTNRLLKKNGKVEIGNVDAFAKALRKENGYNNQLFQ